MGDDWSGMESLLPDSRLSQSQCDNFSTFGNSRRNLLFFMEFATAKVIKLCDTVMMEDPGIRHKLDEL